MFGFGRERHRGKIDLPSLRQKDHEGDVEGEHRSSKKATDGSKKPTQKTRVPYSKKKLKNPNMLKNEQVESRTGIKNAFFGAGNKESDEKIFDATNELDELSLLDTRKQQISESVAKMDAVRSGATAHRFDLADRHERVRHEHGSPVRGILWAVVLLHLLALAVWLRAWLRQRKLKDPVMKGHQVGPPQKQSCSYDLDKNFLPRIELPIKALNMKHSKA